MLYKFHLFSTKVGLLSVRYKTTTDIYCKFYVYNTDSHKIPLISMTVFLLLKNYISYSERNDLKNIFIESAFSFVVSKVTKQSTLKL